MQTECSAERSMFGRVEGRPVVAEFDGGALTSDAGGLLLGAADQRLGLVRRIARCFRDARDPRLVEHSVATLIGQRVFGIALGYEDLNDHDELRHDPLMAVLAGKLEAWRERLRAGGGQIDAEPARTVARDATKYRKIAMSPRRSRPCSSTCSSRRTHGRPSRSSSTSTPPTTRCTAIRKAASFTATMIATATCLFTCSAAGICWRPSSGRRTSTPAPARSRKSRASSRRFAGVGRERASCCAPTPGSPARR